MRKRLSILWMCAILLAACAPFAAPTPVPTGTPIPALEPTLTPVLTLTSTPTPGYPADLAIAMTGGCGGFGCAYHVTIDAAGNVGFQQSGPQWGYDTPPRKVAKITPEQIQELVTAINKANIWALEDQLDPPVGGPTDTVGLTIFVTLNGRSKSVSCWDNAFFGSCRMTPPGATPAPGAALPELKQTIARIIKLDQWEREWPTPKPWPIGVTPIIRSTRTPLPTSTPILSSAKVVLTAFIDANADGTPEPGEGLSGIPVQLRLPDGKMLSAVMQQDGTFTFDMSGFVAGTQITVSLPNLYRSYQFFLPESGAVPVMFSFAQPTLPGTQP